MRALKSARTCSLSPHVHRPNLMEIPHSTVSSICPSLDFSVTDSLRLHLGCYLSEEARGTFANDVFLPPVLVNPPPTHTFRLINQALIISVNFSI